MEKLFELCNGIEYTRSIPLEATIYAKNNNFIVIVGGSDNLMYCFGADSYLTKQKEHGYGWDGSDLKNIDDKKLEKEASQLGLKIWWCGEILETKEILENYDVKKSGSFSYTVNNDISFKNFIIFEDKAHDDIYCTGIIIKLPESFKSAN